MSPTIQQSIVQGSTRPVALPMPLPTRWVRTRQDVFGGRPVLEAQNQYAGLLTANSRVAAQLSSSGAVLTIDSSSENSVLGWDANPVDASILMSIRQEPQRRAEPEPPTLWDVLSEISGTIEGPPDWASEIDHYLYDREED